MAAADAICGGAAGRALGLGRFKGSKKQTLDLQGASAAGRVLLIGAGAKDAVEAADIEQAAASAYGLVKASGVTTLVFDLSALGPDKAAAAAFGVRLGAYRFDRYRTTEKPEQKPSVTKIRIATGQADQARAAFVPLAAMADGVEFTRDLVSEPANVLYPEEFARRVKSLESMGLEVEVLGEAQMAELGMGSLLCVGLGSRRESQLAVIQWKGADDPDAQPIAFIARAFASTPAASPSSRRTAWKT